MEMAYERRRPSGKVWLAAAWLLVALLVLPSPVGRAEDLLKSGPKQFGPVTWLGSGSDAKGVFLRLTGANFTNQRHELTVEWVNQTNEPVIFGEPYSLGKQQDGQWVNVQKDQIYFTAIGYLLFAGDTRRHTYNLSETVNELTPGVYRLSTHFFFDKDVPITEDEKKQIWITFSIV